MKDKITHLYVDSHERTLILHSLCQQVPPQYRALQADDDEVRRGVKCRNCGVCVVL